MASRSSKVGVSHLLRGLKQRQTDICPRIPVSQIIPREEGWPVPRYVGACGRVVVEEYVGETLTSFWNAPWLSRAGFALRLLAAADNFTNSHKDFRFYLTDVSPDNVAVGASGDVYFVDLENVVILDKNTPNEGESVHLRRSVRRCIHGGCQRSN